LFDEAMEVESIQSLSISCSCRRARTMNKLPRTYTIKTKPPTVVYYYPPVIIIKSLLTTNFVALFLQLGMSIRINKGKKIQPMSKITIDE